MKTRILVAAIATALASAPAFATNGYFAHGYGAKAKGMAGAGSVSSKETLVAAANPASLSLVGDRIDLGAELFLPNRHAHVNWVRNADEDGNEVDMFLIPDFGYSQRLNEKVTAGIIVYGNGGMNTKYTRGVYSINPGGANDGNKTGVDLAQLFIAPTVSWDINDNNKIGASLNLAYQRFKAYGLSDFAGYTTSQTTNNLTDLGYDDSFGLGARLGWTGKVNDKTTLGISYATRTYMQKFDKYKELFAEQGDFDIPANLTLGLAFQATPKVGVAFDVQHIFYSDIKSIANGNDDLSGPASPSTALGQDNGKGFGWEDMTIFKLGLDYQATDRLVLRAGVSHGDQPIGSNDTDFNVIAPAVIEDHATVGFTYTLASGNELTGYFMHAFENRVNGNGGAGGDNGTWLEMDQNAIGITYSWVTK